jgi:hypothetical protein
MNRKLSCGTLAEQASEDMMLTICLFNGQKELILVAKIRIITGYSEKQLAPASFKLYWCLIPILRNFSGRLSP